jgi:hypothetical protein
VPRKFVAQFRDIPTPTEVMATKEQLTDANPSKGQPVA